MNPMLGSRRLLPRSAGLVGAFGLWIGIAPTVGAEASKVSVQLTADLWLLNGDSARQPDFLRSQQLAFPPLTTSAFIDILPDGAGPTNFTHIVIPNDIVGLVETELTQTPAEAPLTFAHPGNRFDPFTALFRVRLDNDAGSVRPTGGGNGGIGGSFALNLDTTLVLDRIETDGEFFVASLPLVGALGAGLTKRFTTSIAILIVPGEVSVFGEPWTTGSVTLTRALITRREKGDPAGDPTGFTMFTHRAVGSVASNRISLVTPVVVEMLWGYRPNRVPLPIYGHFRLTFTPEPHVAGPIAAASLLLVILGLRRKLVA